MSCHLLQEVLPNHLATSYAMSTKNNTGPKATAERSSVGRGMLGHRFRERSSSIKSQTHLGQDLAVGTSQSDI